MCRILRMTKHAVQTPPTLKLTDRITQARAARAQAVELGAADRSAVLLWLRYTVAGPVARRQLASDIMRRSVFTQARLMGLVDCASCGDQLCELCAPADRAFAW